MGPTPDAETILVAEDDPTTRELLAQVLTDAGEQALALARAERRHAAPAPP